MKRAIRQNLLAAATVLAGTILTGCAGGAYVMVPVPPPRYGMMGYAPGPGFAWTEGFYDLRGGSTWVWVPGAWRRPPRRGALWVAASWHQEGRAWRFHRGYWR